MIVLGLMGMVAWFGLFAIASSMIYLYAGSFIGGFLSAGAISAATAFISDVTDEEERGGYITKFQAFMMLGAFLPPLIAGYLAEISLSLPFIVMGSIAAIGLILSILLLPETLTKDKKDVSQDETPIKVALSAYTSLGTYLRTNIGPLLIIAFLFAFPSGIYEASLPLLISERQIPPNQAGWIFSLCALSVLIAMLVYVEKSMKRFGEFTVITVCLIGNGILYLFFPHLAAFWMLLTLNIITSLVAAAVRPANTTLITKFSPGAEQGMTQTAYNLYTSVGRVVGPILGGILYSASGATLAFSVAAILFFGAAFYTKRVSSRYAN